MSNRHDALHCVAVVFAALTMPVGVALAQDGAKPELVTNIGHSDWINSVAFSSDGRMALSGGGNGTLKLWDVSSGRLLRTFSERADALISVALSPDGRSLRCKHAENSAAINPQLGA
jgi:WD40 repeat protein